VIGRLAVGGALVGSLALGLGGGFVFSAPPAPALSVSGTGTTTSSCTASGPGGLAARAAYAAGWRGDDLVTAVAIMHAESGWKPAVTNLNGDGSIDYGLMQINSVHAALLAAGDWRDPMFNASVGYELWQKAGGFGPWVTFWDDSYEKYMDAAGQAVAGLSCASTADSGGSLTDPGPGPQGADGLRPRAEEVKAYTQSTWGCTSVPAPCVSTIYGFAARNIAGTTVVSDHATGRAVDLMITPDYKSAAMHGLGLAMAQFWVDHRADDGVHYVIFDRRIWSTEHPHWRPYHHPGGVENDTTEHVNHVHVSLN
jgi:hypothetical protein